MILLGLGYIAGAIVWTALAAGYMDRAFGDLDAMDWGAAATVGVIWPVAAVLTAIVLPARWLFRWFSTKLEEAKSEPR